MNPEQADLCALLHDILFKAAEQSRTKMNTGIYTGLLICLRDACKEMLDHFEQEMGGEL